MFLPQAHLEIHDEPTTQNEATRSCDSTMCNEAMDKEKNSLRSNDVWDMTPLPAGKRVIGLKCVHKVKTTSDSSKQSLWKKASVRSSGQIMMELFVPWCS